MRGKLKVNTNSGFPCNPLGPLTRESALSHPNQSIHPIRLPPILANPVRTLITLGWWGGFGERWKESCFIARQGARTADVAWSTGRTCELLLTYVSRSISLQLPAHQTTFALTFVWSYLFDDFCQGPKLQNFNWRGVLTQILGSCQRFNLQASYRPRKITIKYVQGAVTENMLDTCELHGKKK